MRRSNNVIDAAVRFLRSNPELLAAAQLGASQTGRSVDDLLADAVARARSARQVVAQEEVVARSTG